MITDEFFIGPHLVPGVIQRIEVKPRQENWQITMGAAGGIGAATIWRGLKIEDDAVSIETLITQDGDPLGAVLRNPDDAAAVWTPYLTLLRPTATGKPPSWTCFHPLLLGHWPVYDKFALKANNLRAFRADGLSWVGSLLLVEYKPLRRAAVGPPDPAKIDANKTTPSDALEQEVNDLVNQLVT